MGKLLLYMLVGFVAYFLIVGVILTLLSVWFGFALTFKLVLIVTLVLIVVKALIMSIVNSFY